jgi:hypothetical protein
MKRSITKAVGIGCLLFALAGQVFAGGAQEAVLAVMTTNSVATVLRINGYLDSVGLKVTAGTFVPTGAVYAVDSRGDILFTNTITAAKAYTVYPLRYKATDSAGVDISVTHTNGIAEYQYERKLIVDDVTVYFTGALATGIKSTNTLIVTYDR